MHDIGRTQLEQSSWGEFEGGEYEGGEYENGEYEGGEYEGGEYEGGEYEGGEYEGGEYEGGEYEGGEFEGGEFEFEAHGESPLSEAQEVELAASLLDVRNEHELEQFLGDAFRAAARGAGNFIRSDTGQALGGILKDTLKDAARKALPVVGRAVGSAISPNGGDFGSRAGSAVGTLLGLELEGLSGEDKEFEVARQLVRLTGAAVADAERLPRTVEPRAAALAAVRRAAASYAPGFVPRLPGRSTRSWPRSGRWVRRGRSIVLFS